MGKVDDTKNCREGLRGGGKDTKTPEGNEGREEETQMGQNG